MLKRIITLLVAPVALVLGMSGAANAATASPGEWTCVNTCAVISDGGGNALRLKNDGAYSYAYTSVFASLLTGAKSSQYIDVCATYRTNNAGWPQQPVISNGVWTATLPLNFSNSYVTKCATVFNSASQPFGGAVSVYASGAGTGDNMLMKAVTIN